LPRKRKGAVVCVVSKKRTVGRENLGGRRKFGVKRSLCQKVGQEEGKGLDLEEKRGRVPTLLRHGGEDAIPVRGDA